jgi:hypothetical protein
LFVVTYASFTEFPVGPVGKFEALATLPLIVIEAPTDPVVP